MKDLLFPDYIMKDLLFPDCAVFQNTKPLTNSFYVSVVDFYVITEKNQSIFYYILYIYYYFYY